MDRQDLESRYGMYQDLTRMRTLLCRSDDKKAESNGDGKVCQWFSGGVT